MGVAPLCLCNTYLPVNRIPEVSFCLRTCKQSLPIHSAGFAWASDCQLLRPSEWMGGSWEDKAILQLIEIWGSCTASRTHGLKPLLIYQLFLFCPLPTRLWPTIPWMSLEWHFWDQLIYLLNFSSAQKQVNSKSWASIQNKGSYNGAKSFWHHYQLHFPFVTSLNFAIFLEI